MHGAALIRFAFRLVSFPPLQRTHGLPEAVLAGARGTELHRAVGGTGTAVWLRRHPANPRRYSVQRVGVLGGERREPYSTIIGLMS